MKSSKLKERGLSKAVPRGLRVVVLDNGGSLAIWVPYQWAKLMASIRALGRTLAGGHRAEIGFVSSFGVAAGGGGTRRDEARRCFVLCWLRRANITQRAIRTRIVTLPSPAIGVSSSSWQPKQRRPGDYPS